MKAWILESQEKIEKRPLKLEEVPDPEPEKGEIRIDVKACGICRTDIHIAEGDPPHSKSFNSREIRKKGLVCVHRALQTEQF